jgi:hypothetical protein
MAVLYIEDTKFGRDPVTKADCNLQTGAYAVMGSKEVDVDAVFVAINQPRLARADRLSIARYDREALAAREAEILAIIDAGADPDAPRIAGEEQCKYCRFKLQCPEARGVVAEMSQISIQAPGGALVDNATLEQVLDKCGMAKKLIGEIEAEAKRRLDADPEAFGGRWFLKPGARKKTVTDLGALFTRIQQAHGVSDVAFAKACSITKEKLEALLREASGAKGKALEAILFKALDGLTIEKQNAPSLDRA